MGFFTLRVGGDFIFGFIPNFLYDVQRLQSFSLNEYPWEFAMYQSMILTGVFSLTLLLASCGQMDPLYLPPAKDSAQVATKSKTADKMTNDTKSDIKPVSSEQKINEKNDQIPAVAPSASEPLKK